ncbi:Nif3-like dinuclear metal center hexameric protein [Janibacter indicus]|uniref:Nif3-like dinuclear metal center hexameric protein n=1 Tax=Janibacter indicus TaxID=857417 RepID=UPI003D9A7D41
MSHLRLQDVLAVLEQTFPLDSAQSWDRVGLVTGDPEQPVRRIHAAVDPTLAVIEEAREAGADLLVTHHPLLLRGVHSVATTSAKGAAVTSSSSETSPSTSRTPTPTSPSRASTPPWPPRAA